MQHCLHDVFTQSPPTTDGSETDEASAPRDEIASIRPCEGTVALLLRQHSTGQQSIMYKEAIVVVSVTTMSSEFPFRLGIYED